jgi:amidase
LASDLAPVFAVYDVLLTPTVNEVAPALGAWQFPAEDPMSGWDRMGRFMPPLLTQLANYLGHPAISLPLHTSVEGLPIGVQLTGRFAEEATLLSLAGSLELLRPWATRRPELPNKGDGRES